MERKKVSVNYLMLHLEQGWFPVWFAVEDGHLLVDLRSQDRKVKFVICSRIDSRFITELATQTMVKWYLEIDRMRSDAINHEQDT